MKGGEGGGRKGALCYCFFELLVEKVWKVTDNLQQT